jgi:hypothetical protein
MLLSQWKVKWHPHTHTEPGWKLSQKKVGEIPAMMPWLLMVQMAFTVGSKPALRKLTYFIHC